MRVRAALLISLIVLAASCFAGHYALKPLNPPSFPKNPYGGTIHFDQNSSAYGGNQNGYGASQGDAFYVECEGTITTVYIWVRDQIPDPNNPGQTIDDPLDIPPEEVISQEYCLAVAHAFSEIGGVFADTDNGLGFEPQSGGDPTFAWSISEGTLLHETSRWPGDYAHLHPKRARAQRRERRLRGGELSVRDHCAHGVSRRRHTLLHA